MPIMVKFNCRKKLCLFAFACCLHAVPAFAQSDDLNRLENAALQHFQKGDIVAACNDYVQLEQRMLAEGFAHLQPDLLFNQALCAVHAKQYGTAIAYLKQANLLRRDPETTDAIEKLTRYIEHGVYQTAPNTRFVRGTSDRYDRWEATHAFSDVDYIHLFLVLWIILFALLTGMLILNALARPISRKICAAVFLLWAIGLAIACTGVLMRRDAANDAYGVVTAISNPPDSAFIPGLTVRILSESDSMSLVQRADGVTCRIPTQNIYRLRGKDETP